MHEFDPTIHLMSYCLRLFCCSINGNTGYNTSKFLASEKIPRIHLNELWLNIICLKILPRSSVAKMTTISMLIFWQPESVILAAREC